jgi:exodeoxyribonuclease V beta subunit
MSAENMATRNAFHAETFPLTGRHLIEASAGTGKTYNIANLYLRLIVGDQCAAKTVDQILVVTFTRAATSELRGRIRDKVEQALQAFRGGDCTDDFINGLLGRKATAIQEAARLLNNALLRMDEACIFTIHGFAVRAIQTFLFETGALADVEISEAGNARRERLLMDVWRECQLTTQARLLAYADAAGFASLEKFAAYYSAARGVHTVIPSIAIGINPAGMSAFMPVLDEMLQEKIQPVLAERAALAQEWYAIKDQFVASMLTGSAPLHETELLELTNCLESWLISSDTLLIIPARNRRPYNKLNPFAKGDGVAASVVARLLAHAESSQPIQYYQRNIFRAFLMQYIHVRMQAIDLSSMQLEEVVSLINSILANNDEKAQQLRAVITGSYPVCMVDEFQDTDPAQFEMFNRLYEGASDVGFFMIGDPKQSIYQFRGADIFSYLGVRNQMQSQDESAGNKHIFSLDTNFRSKQALVEATNRLFAETNPDKPTFLYAGIDYIAVKSCEAAPLHRDQGEYSVKHKKLSSRPLVFVGNNASDDACNGETLRGKYARDTAQRIALLLDGSQGGVIRKQHAQALPVRGGDIAVLVRTAREATAVREALLQQQPRIGSVFQSQRDSVFQSSSVAVDLYHLLCAMDEPGDKRLLKKALVTLLYRGFALDFSALEAIDADDITSDVFFEQCIAEFSEYRDCWDQYGVLTAINRLVQKQELLQKIALLPDGDRLVTDLRHLGELLQVKSMECGSREQLILWLGRQLHDDSELDEDSKRIRLESDENLVKIVTIHVSKGLEYPIVFLPFFFLPWQADSHANLPLYHPAPDFHACVDFAADAIVVEANMQREMQAEDMRLLYVAMTRAVYQCYIGISAATYGIGKRSLLPDSVWAHLLSITDSMPSWDVIRSALQQTFGSDNLSVAYHTLFDTPRVSRVAVAQEKSQAKLVDAVSLPALQPSSWRITSYSALAHAKKDPGMQRGGADELLRRLSEGDDALREQDDLRWTNDIRYTLKGSSYTGDCLHGFFEQIARDPARYFMEENNTANVDRLLQYQLRRHGIEKPEGYQGITETEREQAYAVWRQDILQWLDTVLNANMQQAGGVSLRDVIVQKQVLPELSFDFSIGTAAPAQISAGINRVLRDIGMPGISIPYCSELSGLVTGSIDLLFIHDKSVYILDYKSNTLGKSPRCYDEANMRLSMQENRYDLQYMIYSVAAHRYMQQRLGARYHFDDGEYRFGGVFYFFLRGMGLADYPDSGVYFTRPSQAQIEALDAAFSGEVLSHG